MRPAGAHRRADDAARLLVEERRGRELRVCIDHLGVHHRSRVDALRVVGSLARARHDGDCRSFQTTQAELLRGLLEKNKATAYGADRGFEKMCAADDVVAAYRRESPKDAAYVEGVRQAVRSRVV